MRKIIKEGVDFGKIAEKAVAIIKGKGHNIIMFTLDGVETSDPEEARRLYVKDPNFMVTIEVDDALIRINKNSNVELNEIEGVMSQLKNLAREYMLKTELKVFGKEIAPKDFAYQAKKYRDKKMDPVSEAALSRMSGSKKTSYQTLESTKIIVRHRKPVDEDVRGSRSRQIKAIFIENAGERFRFPHNNLAGARAMARHIDEGGAVHDDVGNYIIESVGNMLKLVEFVRYSRRNKLINETSEDIVKVVRENITAYRKELQRFQGVKSYNAMCEQIANREGSEIEEDTAELQDMFTVRKFDEKIGETLPLIKRLVTEKNAWRSMIEEASTEAFVVTSTENLIENDAIEFDSPVQKLGYKLRTLSERVAEESELSKFVHKVSNKVIEGKELSKFEKSVMRNVLEHVVVVEEEVAEEDGFVDKLDEVMTDFERKMKLLEFDLDWDDEINEEPGDWDHGYNYEGPQSDDLGYDPETQWMDPAGGIHDNDEEDPAAMYEDERRMLELAGIELEEGWRDKIAGAATGYINKKLIKQMLTVLDHTTSPVEAAMHFQMSMDKKQQAYALNAIKEYLAANPDSPDYDRLKKFYGMAGGKLEEAGPGNERCDDCGLWRDQCSCNDEEGTEDWDECPHCHELTCTDDTCGQ